MNTKNNTSSHKGGAKKTNRGNVCPVCTTTNEEVILQKQFCDVNAETFRSDTKDAEKNLAALLKPIIDFYGEDIRTAAEEGSDAILEWWGENNGKFLPTLPDQREIWHAFWFALAIRAILQTLGAGYDRKVAATTGYLCDLLADDVADYCNRWWKDGDHRSAFCVATHLRVIH